MELFGSLGKFMQFSPHKLLTLYVMSLACTFSPRLAAAAWEREEYSQKTISQDASTHVYALWGWGPAIQSGICPSDGSPCVKDPNLLKDFESSLRERSWREGWQELIEKCSKMDGKLEKAGNMEGFKDWPYECKVNYPTPTTGVQLCRVRVYSQCIVKLPPPPTPTPMPPPSPTKTSELLPQMIAKVDSTLQATTTLEGRPCTQCEIKALPIAPQTSFKIEVDPSCKDFYGRLYDGPEIEIAVAFGYDDMLNGDGSVSKRNYAVIQTRDFETRLGTPCKDAENPICGFTHLTEDPTLWRKKVTVLGEERTLAIRVISSASATQETQDYKSERATIDFLKSLRSARAVMYLGHSRNGGGPDFFPAKTAARSERKGPTIDYDWYRKNRPGLSLITRIFDENPGRQPVLFGSFSCDSKKHFQSELSRHAPETSLVLAEQSVKPSDSEAALIKTLTQLLNGKCSVEFKGASQRKFKNVAF